MDSDPKGYHGTPSPSGGAASGEPSGSFRGAQSDTTREIIGAFYAVYNELGYGVAEKVYENALALELCERGLAVQQQSEIAVSYHGQEIGIYYVDLLVSESVIGELKAVDSLHPAHEAQLLSYLKASLIEVGLLLNFGPTATVRRKVSDNARKGSLSWTKR